MLGCSDFKGGCNIVGLISATPLGSGLSPQEETVCGRRVGSLPN